MWGHEANWVGPWATQSAGLLVVEFFAGPAELSAATAKAGLPTAKPQDKAQSGFDLATDEGLHAAQVELRQLAGHCKQLYVHLAPPCSTFSRARDRSRKTSLRSSRRPHGIAPGPEVLAGNAVALRAARLAVFAVTECGASVSMENPAISYLWPFLDEAEAFSG